MRYFFLILAFVSPSVFAQEKVKAKIEVQDDPIQVSLQDKIRDQEKAIDSLILLIVKMKEKSIVQDIDESKDLDEDIIKLGKLALKLDQSLFEVLNEESAPEEIRKYFLPRFSANFVTINKDGQGSIAIVTHENIGDHLGSIQEDQQSYKIVNIDFLDTKVAGDVFNMAYKTKVETYLNGEFYAELSILTTLTGKREDHNWRIGSYSSTSIAFEPEN